MIEIYGKTSCHKCLAATRYCDARHLKYEYKLLDKDFTRDEVLTLFPGAKEFPQIKINGKVIGGLDQMVTYIETMDYTNKQ